jgi:hypothetical protein
MMRLAPVLVALSAWLLIGNAAPRIAPLAPRELDLFRDFGESYRSYPQPPLSAWERDLRHALPGADVDRAADALAPRYGLSSADMRSLVRLWLSVLVRQYDRSRDPAQTAELRRQLLALLPATRRAPLVLEAVAESLDRLTDCSGEDFAAMMAGSADAAADAWTIANSAVCGDNFLRAAAAAPDRAMPALIRFATYGSLSAKDELPIDRWLTSPAALARVAEADRPALSAWLHVQYAKRLFAIGLADQAVALIESLPQSLRSRVLALPAGSFTAHVDGLPVMVRVDEPDFSVKLSLTAAYALRGRTAEAEALFDSLGNLRAARHAFDCAWQIDRPSVGGDCEHIPYEQSISRTIDLLLLDHLLHHPDDDPYPLAEAGFAGMGASSGEEVTELRCRVFSERRFAEICDDARLGRISWGGLDADRPGAGETRAALEALTIPGLAEARAETAAALAPLIAAAETARPGTSFTRPTVIPAPVPFVELPLPGAYRGARPPEPPRAGGFATLPEGFLPVRFERSGSRAVAISLSQTYDPTGEVSQGGYWVHLSDDGGRHWQRPLYTGLADRFSYVVPSASRMPMLNGDRLDLEVEVAELDTASITYPPVALRSRRRATNLYLQIPLAELARDSNGDGLTDIAAQRLLLDRARTDGGTPFILGSDAGTNCGALDRERTARIALLGQLFNESGRALVERLDRPAGYAGLVPPWRAAGAAVDRPIFIRGDARDYFCLRPNRLMIVYSESDLTGLGRFHPDFHAVEMPQIIFNRARDRGFARWSAGWTGGTYRLRLVNGAWILDSISGWIT